MWLIVDKSSKQCLSVECTWCWAHWEQQNNTTFRFSSPRLWCVGIALLSDIQCLENVTWKGNKMRFLLASYQSAYVAEKYLKTIEYWKVVLFCNTDKLNDTRVKIKINRCSVTFVWAACCCLFYLLLFFFISIKH